jgi:hypothetical protein
MMMDVPKSSADLPVRHHSRASQNPESQGNVAVLVRGRNSGQEKVSINISRA